ncbi:MAG: glyoxalase, partial [Clostridiales bacterium]|nr:glyoxalase [Clostridiales bacterium]
MGEYDDVVIRTFLEKQLQLFPEVVAETPEEAEEFLDICMASV